LLDQDHRFDFVNPKAGIFIEPGTGQQAYLSFARASREPNRDNFTDAEDNGPLPKYETLNNIELGYQIRSINFTAGINLYHMAYNDQLVLTGKINDVGAPVMVNVDKSHRRGIEMTWGIKILPSLQWDANATLSRNKIKDFTEYVDDWDNGGQQAFKLGTTDLSFSPGLTANSHLRWNTSKKAGLGLISHYAGKQYIDNTSDDSRMLNAWLVSNLTGDYTIKTPLFSEATFRFSINNLFNALYESNAWVYSYILGGERFKMDGYFPQAGRHFMVGLDLKF
jgi:iron complex outermembrane recepter protein